MSADYGAHTTYNARQAAQLLGVTEATVRRWIADKLLPASRTGREWEIPIEGLALMPRDRKALVAEGVRVRAAPSSLEYTCWITACWQHIAEAAFVVHGPAFANGCHCRLCQAMSVLAAGFDPVALADMSRYPTVDTAHIGHHNDDGGFDYATPPKSTS